MTKISEMPDPQRQALKDLAKEKLAKGENPERARAIINFIDKLENERGIGEKVSPAGRSLPKEVTPMERVEDAARSLAAGIGRGVTGLAGSAVDVATMLHPQTRRMAMQEGIKPSMQPALEAKADQLTGGRTAYKPTTGASGEVPYTLGQYIPGAALGARSVPEAAAFAAIPALAEEGAGRAAKTVLGEPWEQPARMVGSIASLPLAQRMATPFPGTPEARAAAGVLSRAGNLKLPAGNRIGSRALRTMQARDPDVADAANLQMHRQFTEMIMEQSGLAGVLRELNDRARAQAARTKVDPVQLPTNKTDPEALAAAGKEIGRRFDEVAKVNQVDVDAALADDVFQAVDKYIGSTSKKNDLPDYLQHILQVVHKAAKSKQSRKIITGEEFQDLRTRAAALAEAGKADPVGRAGIALEKALMDAMERSAVVSGDPQLVRRFNEARRLWRDFRAIEKASMTSNTYSRMGLITPGNLNNAIKQQHKRTAAGVAERDLAELSEKGALVMQEIPSGISSAEKGAPGVRATQGLLGGAAGHTISGGDPYVTAAGMAAGSILPRMARGAMNWPPVDAYLGNARWMNPPTAGVMAAIEKMHRDAQLQ